MQRDPAYLSSTGYYDSNAYWKMRVGPAEPLERVYQVSKITKPIKIKNKEELKSLTNYRISSPNQKLNKTEKRGRSASLPNLLVKRSNNLNFGKRAKPPNKGLSYYSSLAYTIRVKAVDEGISKYWIANIVEFPNCSARGSTATAALRNVEKSKIEWIKSKIKQK